MSLFNPVSFANRPLYVLVHIILTTTASVYPIVSNIHHDHPTGSQRSSYRVSLPPDNRFPGLTPDIGPSLPSSRTHGIVPTPLHLPCNPSTSRPIPTLHRRTKRSLLHFPGHGQAKNGALVYPLPVPTLCWTSQ